MSYQHAVVWIDHLHATVIDFSVDDQHVAVVEREGGQRQVHRKSGEPGPGKRDGSGTPYAAVIAGIGAPVPRVT